MATFLYRVPVRVIISDPVVDDREKGMEGTDVRWQARCCLMSPSCLRGEDSLPLFSQRIHWATKVIRPLQHQTQGLCFLFLEATYLAIDVLLERQPTCCVQDNVQVTGVWMKKTPHKPHVEFDVSLWNCYLTQRLCACRNAMFWLFMHQQALFWYILRAERIWHQHTHENMSWLFDSCIISNVQNQAKIEIVLHFSIPEIWC